MAVDPVIRRASEADIPVIAAFDRKSNPDSAYRPEWLSGQLEDLLVAEIISPPRLDGRLPWFPRAAMRALGLAPRGPALAGYLLGMVLEEWEPRAALVRDVIVAEEMRRRGIGERLVRAAVETWRRDGVREVHATVKPDNFASAALFRKLGFTRGGLRADDYLLLLAPPT